MTDPGTYLDPDFEMPSVKEPPSEPATPPNYHFHTAGTTMADVEQNVAAFYQGNRNALHHLGTEVDPPRKQIGGNHYNKHGMQPFDIIDEYELDFYEGNALKYLLRWKDKNGVEDLEKAKHYIEEVIKREAQYKQPGRSDRA